MRWFVCVCDLDLCVCVCVCVCLLVAGWRLEIGREGHTHTLALFNAHVLHKVYGYL